MKNKLMVFYCPFLLLCVSGLLFGMDTPQDLLIAAFNTQRIDTDILEFLEKGASVRVLVDNGIDINTQSAAADDDDLKGGDTLLHILATYGKVGRLTRMLTSVHPNPMLRNNAGLLPIDMVQFNIDQHRKQMQKLRDSIDVNQAQHKKLVDGIEKHGREKIAPDNKAWHDNTEEIKLWWSTKYSVTALNAKLARLERSLNNHLIIHDVLSRYSHYYEAGLPERFTIEEQPYEKFFRNKIPQIKGFFGVMFLSSGVVGFASLVNVIFKRNATSRLSALRNHLLKVKTSLLNIDFDIHNAEFIVKPVDELFTVEDIAKDADQYATLSAALNRFDELVLALYERIKESYFYHPASYLLEQESVLVNELEQAHLAITAILDECLVGKSIKKSMLTLFGSAFVGAGSWWCYKRIHHLKKWGLF